MKIFPILCLVLYPSMLVHAQDPQPRATLPPLPPGPLVQLRAPEQAKWIIKTAHPEPTNSKGAPEQGKQQSAPENASIITMIKSGKILVRSTTDGGLWQRWCVSDVQITIYPDGKNFLVQTRPPTVKQYENPFYTDYSSSDFPGFEWVSLKNYIGIKPFAGHQCIVFKDRFKLFTDDDGPSDLVACIDYETRYPVALSINKELRTYSFEPPPQAPLSPPPIVQSILSDRQKSLDSASRAR